MDWTELFTLTGLAVAMLGGLGALGAILIQDAIQAKRAEPRNRRARR